MLAAVRLVEEAEKQAQTGVISKELAEKIIAIDLSLFYRDPWAQSGKEAPRAITELVQELALKCPFATGQPADTGTKRIPIEAFKGAERTEAVDLLSGLGLAFFVVKTYRAHQEARHRALLKLKCDRQAIPGGDDLNKVLRYVAATDRELGRALDRLERLQRRRKGEPVLPPVSVRLTQ